MELKELIEKSKKKIEEKNQSLSKLDKDLTRVKAEIKLAEEKFLKLKNVKILTRKQMELIKKEKLKKERQDFENQKMNIGIETKEAFKKAGKILEESQGKSLEEYEAARNKARKIEVEALKKEAFILNCVMNEKEKKYEDMLAIKVCREVNRKNKDRGKKSSEDLCQKVGNLRNLDEICARLKKEIYDVNMKYKTSLKRLESY